jgi:hypothetical protein
MSLPAEPPEGRLPLTRAPPYAGALPIERGAEELPLTWPPDGREAEEAEPPRLTCAPPYAGALPIERGAEELLTWPPDGRLELLDERL